MLNSLPVQQDSTARVGLAVFLSFLEVCEQSQTFNSGFYKFKGAPTTLSILPLLLPFNAGPRMNFKVALSGLFKVHKLLCFRVLLWQIHSKEKVALCRAIGYVTTVYSFFPLALKCPFFLPIILVSPKSSVSIAQGLCGPASLSSISHLSFPLVQAMLLPPSGYLPRRQVIQDLWTPQEKWMEVCCPSVLLYWSWALPWPVRQWLGMDGPVSWHLPCLVTGDDQIFLTRFAPWVQGCLSLDYGFSMRRGGSR